MYQNLLFDLDGTLTNSAEGITKCVQYALASMNIHEPDLKKLYPFIGPPLRASFEKFYGLTPREAEAGVIKYRERFAKIGMYENAAYEGMPELVRDLAQAGYTLGMATGKPQIYAVPIAQRFGFAPYFKAMVGSSLDGSLDNKALVVAEALRQLGITTSEEKQATVLIGDRKEDVLAAHANGISCIGVGYGFGGYDELCKARADGYAATIGDLRKMILKEANQ